MKTILMFIYSLIYGGIAMLSAYLLWTTKFEKEGDGRGVLAFIALCIFGYLAILCMIDIADAFDREKKK